MGRRGFLKRVGAAALTVVAAPLFVPSERLEFGVPKQRLIVPEPDMTREFVWSGDELGAMLQPIRHGDGIHDDAPWVRAELARLSETGGVLYFPPGNYLLEGITLDLPLNVGLSIHDSHFTWTLPDGAPMINIPANHSAGVRITDSIFISRRRAVA